MSYFTYLGCVLWELTAAVLCTLGLSLPILDGFLEPELVSEQLSLLLMIALPILTAAFCLAYNRKTALAGLILMAAGLLALLRVCSLHRGDAAGPVYAVAVLVPLTIFFLSRTAAGSGILLALGTLAISGSVFLQYGSRPLCLILFLFGGGCMLLSRSFRRSAETGRARHLSAVCQGFTAGVVCLLSLILAFGVFRFVVVPLAPPTMEVKLMTELKQLPLLKKLGVSSTIHLPDPDQAAQPPENTPRPEPAPTPPQGSTAPEAPSLPPQEESEAPADIISYEDKNYSIILAAISLILIIASVIALIHLRRRLRLKRILRLPPNRQVIGLYNGLLRRLQLCDLPPPGGLTPRQWCDSFQSRCNSLLPSPDALERVTDIFEAVCYGGQQPSDEDIQLMLDAYDSFPRRCRRTVGTMRYIRCFFLL